MFVGDGYDAEILGREQIGNKKCYFVESDNPEFQFNDKISEIRRWMDLLKQRSDITGMPGYAIVWKPDVIVGEILANLRGFNISDYEFPDFNEIPLKNYCQIVLEIGGKESEFLRNSKNTEDYLSKWILQDRFKQEHQFEL